MVIDTSFHTPIGFKTNSTFTVKISCIVLDTINQKIYVGGDGTGFTTYDNVARKNLVRLNWDGSIDPNFNIGTGFNNGVKKILLQPDGKIIVVGNFTTFDGAAFNRILRPTCGNRKRWMRKQTLLCLYRAEVEI